MYMYRTEALPTSAGCVLCTHSLDREAAWSSAFVMLLAKWRSRERGGEGAAGSSKEACVARQAAMIE